MIETNPDALAIAERLDVERVAGRARGPLHGVPVLLKDSIDTADGMLTTAGSLALAANRPTADAPLVSRLRDAGAIILGKTNMSEWAGFRSPGAVGGWSGRGGLTVNPHALDRSPGSSSSGAAAAVAAGLAPLAVGVETDGSIVCPAALCGVVGLKPTHNLIRADGIVPVSRSQDTPGAITRSVRDAALLLDALAPVPAGATFVSACTTDGVHELRIGLPRRALWGYSPEADDCAEGAVRALAAHGVTVVDGTDLPTIDLLTDPEEAATMMMVDYKSDIERYLRSRGPGTPKTLRELIEFNRLHADTELRYFGQSLFERLADLSPYEITAYRRLLLRTRGHSGPRGIDVALRAHRLDALVMPSYPPAWKIDLVDGDPPHGRCASPSAMAGYPLLTVPSGIVGGLPLGVAFAGTAYSERKLIKLAYTVEKALNLDMRPKFRGSRPDD